MSVLFPEDSIHQLSVSPDSRLVAVADLSYKVTVLELKSKEVIFFIFMIDWNREKERFTVFLDANKVFLHMYTIVIGHRPW